MPITKILDNHLAATLELTYPLPKHAYSTSIDRKNSRKPFKSLHQPAFGPLSFGLEKWCEIFHLFRTHPPKKITVVPFNQLTLSRLILRGIPPAHCLLHAEILFSNCKISFPPEKILFWPKKKRPLRFLENPPALFWLFPIRQNQNTAPGPTAFCCLLVKIISQPS